LGGNAYSSKRTTKTQFDDINSKKKDEQRLQVNDARAVVPSTRCHMSQWPCTSRVLLSPEYMESISNSLERRGGARTHVYRYSYLILSILVNTWMTEMDIASWRVVNGPRKMGYGYGLLPRWYRIALTVLTFTIDAFSYTDIMHVYSIVLEVLFLCGYISITSMPMVAPPVATNEVCMGKNVSDNCKLNSNIRLLLKKKADF